MTELPERSHLGQTTCPDDRVLSVRLGAYQDAVNAALTELKNNRIIERIWAHDHTVWKDDPTEITNRLGWLHSPEVMVEQVPKINALVNAVRGDGYTHTLLLGMGGSSLAPEVFRKTFGAKEGYLDLAVLDSTDPSAVLHHADRLDLTKTLFIVSTKSGGTVETLSFFKFFYNRMVELVGVDRAGAHFIAITDPGSPLTDLAKEYHFRTIFLNDPNVGGRYSALSYFGLVPAALIGVDLKTLLDRAMIMVHNCGACNSTIEGNHPGGRLGAIIGELAKVGRDKVALVVSPGISSFGDWVEQLIAESTGKEGKGILPVVGESVGAPDVYGDDRLFVYIRLKDDETHETGVQTLEEAGHPMVRLYLNDLYDLGGQFLLWEIATAVAGSRLHINPFDQPNVEAAKALAHRMVTAYQRTGNLPERPPTFQKDGIAVYGDVSADTPGEALSAFLHQAQLGAYVALQAYVQPTAEIDGALQALRTQLRDCTRLAVTVGYGPRFLHSTGQLHKGDAGKGLFIQFTADDPRDVPIPDQAGATHSSITFGVLKAAQALGDRQALLDAGRQVIRFHLDKDVVGGLKKLIEALA